MSSISCFPPISRFIRKNICCCFCFYFCHFLSVHIGLCVRMLVVFLFRRMLLCFVGIFLLSSIRYCFLLLPCRCIYRILLIFRLLLLCSFLSCSMLVCFLCRLCMMRSICFVRSCMLLFRLRFLFLCILLGLFVGVLNFLQLEKIGRAHV